MTITTTVACQLRQLKNFTVLLLSALMLALPVQSQDSVVNLSSFRNIRFIDSLALYTLTAPGDIEDHELSHLKFNRYLPKGIKDKLPGDWVEKELYLKFALHNDTDLVRNIAFYPGMYFTVNRTFRADTNSQHGYFRIVRDTVTDIKPVPGYTLIVMQPNQKSEFIVRLRFLRASQNTLAPLLMRADYIEKHRALAAVKRSSLDVVTYVASGMMLMMIFYSLAVYTQNGSKEFLYYALYALCTGSMLFLIAFLSARLNHFNYLYIEYLDLMLLCTSVLCYLAFMKTFLNTRVAHPFLHKLFNVGQVMIVLMMVIYTLLYFFTLKFHLLVLVEEITKILTLLLGVTFITYGLRNRDRLMRFVVAGNIALVSFSLVSLIMLMLQFQVTQHDGFSLLNRPLIYYILGLVIELMLFLTGLAFKNRIEIVERVKERERLKLENERKEFEKQMAVMAAQQNERDRISADMHDELGSGVTAIRLMSEIVKSKMNTMALPEIDKISNSANELLNKMNTIIWTMKSSNDTLESMIAYVRAHATEYFDSTPIQCSVRTPVNIPDIDMSGEKRRNIFLAVKESLTNIIKHAQATEVDINITTYSDRLVIEVADNGKGMDVTNTRRFGNGLANMRRRMESIGGTLTFHQNNGTTLRFELDL